MTGYFEIIKASSTHIYHSALVLAPQESIVRKLYGSRAYPFTRVVHGVPKLWDQRTAATTRPSTINLAVWSPCNRFIATTWDGAATIDVLDSVTLRRLQTFESPRDISKNRRVLVFSPDSRILTCSGCDYPGGFDLELSVSSWDLQTGGLTSIIRWEEQYVMGNPYSITYSANGTMVAMLCQYTFRSPKIFICDVASGMYTHSHSLNFDPPLSKDIWIWTHGECLRFATADVATITIWEVGFTLGAMLMKVETLPHPEGFYLPRSFLAEDRVTTKIQLLLTPCRLALVSDGRILVWDAWNSERLLDCADTTFCPSMTFSSDGSSFACSTIRSDIYLWKESPTGYALHGILASNTVSSNLQLSRDGESIVAFGGHTIQLWRTTGFTFPPSSTLTRAPPRNNNFVLEFSPDGTLATTAMRQDNTVTVLDLKSGAPRLTIDAGVKVCGVGMVWDAVVVVGDREVITWNLPAGDCVPGARLNREDSARTTNLDYQAFIVDSAVISPDFSYIAFTGSGGLGGLYITIYHASTGKRLGYGSTKGTMSRFTPDGCDLWCATGNDKAEVWRVGGQPVLERLEERVNVEHPSEGCPWASSRGYRVTNNWWILGPDGKRLLMLPPHWQSYAAVDRVWKGKFLALLHAGLSEPVILEMEP